MPEQTEKTQVHWGSNGSRPTSLHGNGAASFDRTTLDALAVTCRLCLSLIQSSAWIDRQGDVWQFDGNGLLVTPETRPFTFAYVEKKWGPLLPIGRASEVTLPPAGGEG